jgi:hypothetical protein
MIAFEVYVNKVKVCTAGLGDFESIIGSLLCHVNQDGRPDERRLTFHVSAFGDKRVYQWVHYDLQVGNRVEIRIVNTSKTDEPKELKCPGGACGT